MKQLSLDAFRLKISPETLSSGSIFGALSEQATLFLLEHGKLYAASAGEKIFQYGDRGDSFFIVCAGSLEFLKQHEGEYIQTRVVGFGEEVGFVAMIALHDHVGNAIAREDSFLLEVNTLLFSELHQNYPLDFGLLLLNLARDLARVVRKLGNKLVENSIHH
jgi:CRP-like cAMP-binding protein